MRNHMVRAAGGWGTLLTSYVHGDSTGIWTARSGWTISNASTATYTSNHARLTGDATGQGRMSIPFTVQAGKQYRFVIEASDTTGDANGTEHRVNDSVATSAGTLVHSIASIGSSGGTAEDLWTNTEGNTTLYYRVETANLGTGTTVIGSYSIYIYEI